MREIRLGHFSPKIVILGLHFCSEPNLTSCLIFGVHYSRYDDGFPDLELDSFDLARFQAKKSSPLTKMVKWASKSGSVFFHAMDELFEREWLGDSFYFSTDCSDHYNHPTPLMVETIKRSSGLRTAAMKYLGDSLLMYTTIFRNTHKRCKERFLQERLSLPRRRTSPRDLLDGFMNAEA
jgi:hypothetical protein